VNIIRKIIRRIKSISTRIKKLSYYNWLDRLNKTFDRFWMRFNRMSISEKTLLWGERNINRIIKVKPPWRKI
jgi:hypothetical protein